MPKYYPLKITGGKKYKEYVRQKKEDIKIQNMK